MAPTTAVCEREIMSESDQQCQDLQKQVDILHQNLRAMRHAINNHVAVLMAMAELSQRNPAHSQKLSQVCLDKAPQISAQIAEFSLMFERTLHLSTVPPS